jgi:hypothetical protein
MANGDGFFLIKVAGVWTQFTAIPESLVTNLVYDITRTPAAEPSPARAPSSPIAPVSFGGFPTGPLAVPANLHRVNTLAAILGA